MRRTPLQDGWELAARRWLDAPLLGFSKVEWLAARVPGQVHLDLVAHGVIAHPFEAMNELGCQWVDDEDWSYRTKFSFTPDPALPHRVLRFEGLDTVCSVLLNGKVIGQHDDMFNPIDIDVTDDLVSGANELRVDFLSASRVGRERRAKYLAKEGLDETVLRLDDRAFVRKAQYMFGWDWGPRLVSAGIWRPVALLEHRGRIVDVHVTQRHASDGSVELRFRSRIDNASGREGAGSHEPTVVHFVSGVDGAIRDGDTLRIAQPQLWWPAGQGEQHLYQVTSLLVPAGTPAGKSLAEIEPIALDRRDTRIGLRTVRLIREPDRFGESFQFEVNGRAAYALGANWIPDDSFPSEVSKSRVRTQIERARDMNMNMLRVWGGGLYESDEFYDACDELGILVWQDFPYACSYYPDDEDGCAVARREAAQAITRLRNRPSLVLWCGNNENLTMFEDKWGGGPTRHPPRYLGERIYDGVLPAVLAELDADRPYIATSPFGGQKSNDGGTGDQHYWDVWHGRGDWKFYADSTGRFASEFGFAAAPGHQAWRKIAPGVAEPFALGVRDERARWHDKTMKGYETFIGYVELHYPVARDIEEWTYYSQLNQRDALRFGIEHYRRSEFCRGTLIWQLNDCWPVQSWAVVDSAGQYKAAAYELRRLYAPALASIVVSEGRAELWVALDNAKSDVSGTAVLEARSLTDGKCLKRWDADAKLSPDSRRLALTANLADFDPADTIVVATWAGSTTFRLLAEPKSVRLPAPRLRVSREPGVIVIETDVPVVDLYVWDAADTARLIDNFATLPAGGRCTLRIEGTPTRLAARSLFGRHAIDV